jgi:hypothetical protein
MPDEEKSSSSWKSVVAIASLAISLFGNVVQYQALQAKKKELDQAQHNIDTSDEAARHRQDSIDSQMVELKARMRQIDEQLKEAADDNSRAQTGLAIGRPEDADYARGLLADSITRHNNLLDEKKQLQEKIDALQLMK